jgi:hypothetical protein
MPWFIEIGLVMIAALGTTASAVIVYVLEYWSKPAARFLYVSTVVGFVGMIGLGAPLIGVVGIFCFVGNSVRLHRKYRTAP